jgi:hypothetical protein
MKVRIEGTLKNRVRVKVLWFWIVKPWQHIPFTWEHELPNPSMSAFLPVSGVPIEIRLSNATHLVDIEIRVMGQEIWQFVHDVRYTTRYKSELIKGNIIEATVSVS